MAMAPNCQLAGWNASLVGGRSSSVECRMNLSLFVRGLLIGFSIAAPVGPIGVLCIRRTLADGRLAGLLTGLGAATADVLYGCIAGIGLTMVSDMLVDQQVWIRLIGGCFLCYLGLKTLVAFPAEHAAPAAGPRLLQAYTSTLVLTLTNPMTILSFAATFAGLGAGGAGSDYRSALMVVLGVFLSSALWWLMLTGGAGLLRTMVTPNALRWVNRVSGLFILGFGLLALADVR